MEIKLQKIDKSNIENEFHTTNYYTKSKSIEDQLNMCRCWHSICGHRFIPKKWKAGKCDYPYCKCIEFVVGEIEIYDEFREIEENVRKYEGGLF